MRILRSVNRRGFIVASAGWFTVLKPNTWFPASRLPGNFCSYAGQSKGIESPQAHENPTENPTTAPTPEITSVPDQNALDHVASQKTAIPLQIMIPSTHDHRLFRPALIILAAIAITWMFLWWIGHP